MEWNGMELVWFELVLQFSVEFPRKVTPFRKTLIEEEEKEPKPKEDADPQQSYGVR
jgi:hypothetical protein